VSSEATPKIVTAEPHEAPYLAGLIAAAFHPLDAAVWQIGDEDLRRAVFPGYFQSYVDLAVRGGVIEVTEDRTALAAWVFEDGGPAPAPQPPAPHLAAMLGPVWAERIYEFDCRLHAAMPAPGRAFEHLAVLATRPGLQGKGLGSALLEHRLAHLDREGIPAHLEASGPDTRRVYLKFGFVDDGEPIRLPDGPEMYPMWREPQAH
jgi:GNAT superfamily N-acetyltransferase